MSILRDPGPCEGQGGKARLDFWIDPKHLGGQIQMFCLGQELIWLFDKWKQVQLDRALKDYWKALSEQQRFLIYIYKTLIKVNHNNPLQY